jgi:hypothetical protein
MVHLLLFATFTDAAVLLCCCAAVVLYVVQAVQYVVCDVFSSNKKSIYLWCFDALGAR